MFRHSRVIDDAQFDCQLFSEGELGPFDHQPQPYALLVLSVRRGGFIQTIACPVHKEQPAEIQATMRYALIVDLGRRYKEQYGQKMPTDAFEYLRGTNYLEYLT